MKTKIIFISLLVILCSASPGLIKAQTPGTLTFSVTTTCPSGQFSPRHLVAIWIQNSSVSGASGAFIKTKVRYGTHYLSFLNAWYSASAQSVTDATTGATRNIASETLTFTWNATNVSGSIVPDGTYYIWMQMTAANANGATAYVSFTKGPSPETLTPAATGNYSNININWVPQGLGVNENSSPKQNISVSPNPVTSLSRIMYSLDELSDVTITLHDITGKLISVILDGNQDSGSYSLPLTGVSELKQGIYFIKIYTGKTQNTVKIFIP
ncbi:MAG TPA: T9SS type A sorting domain-containing protein [Bacteroidales bacterium]|nr:T9SS type A sorting domain-containing protein [Bacteroidales bacterium]